jgi:hypothetical protein
MPAAGKIAQEKTQMNAKGCKHLTGENAKIFLVASTCCAETA